jgi:hypothetical protein
MSINNGLRDVYLFTKYQLNMTKEGNHKYFQLIDFDTPTIIPPMEAKCITKWTKHNTCSTFKWNNVANVWAWMMSWTFVRNKKLNMNKLIISSFFVIRLYCYFEQQYVNITICILNIWWIKKLFPSMVPLSLFANVTLLVTSSIHVGIRRLLPLGSSITLCEYMCN